MLPSKYSHFQLSLKPPQICGLQHDAISSLEQGGVHGDVVPSQPEGVQPVGGQLEGVWLRFLTAIQPRGAGWEGGVPG